MAPTPDSLAPSIQSSFTQLQLYPAQNSGLHLARSVHSPHTGDTTATSYLYRAPNSARHQAASKIAIVALQVLRPRTPISPRQTRVAGHPACEALGVQRWLQLAPDPTEAWSRERGELTKHGPWGSCSCLRAAVTNHHKFGWRETTDIHSHSSGGQKSKTKV